MLLQLPNLELDSLLSRFYGSVWTKNCMNGVYKTNIDCFFIQGMIEMIVPSVKFNLRASVNSRPKLNFTSGTNIFHHSPHEQSIFVYYADVLLLQISRNRMVRYFGLLFKPGGDTEPSCVSRCPDYKLFIVTIDHEELVKRKYAYLQVLVKRKYAYLQVSS